ncbi:MAG TPA: M28 family peptidase [Gammaproteobacteria bacterium]|nr:M28 family peptidase [Gammaproteobacteria bacterium]
MATRALLMLPCFCLSLTAFAAGPLPPPREEPVLHDIAAAVSPAELEVTDTRLVGFGTRSTLSDTKSDKRGIGAAERWVKSRFEQISKDCGGCLEIVTPSQVFKGERMPKDGVEVMDVVAIQKGTEDSDRYVVMTGHIDSRVSDVMDATKDAPGADDDGSGTSAVIEAARVLSKYKFRANVVYSVDAGEEQGLYGGQVIARYALDRHWYVEADLNNDIMGNSHGQNGVVDNTSVRVFSEGTRALETPKEASARRYHGGEIDSPSRNVARYMQALGEQYVPNWHVKMVYRTDRYGRGGDQTAFNALGFPAVRVTEANEDFTHQHQDVRVQDGIHYGDTLSGVDFDYLAKVTAMNAVTLAAMAWAPAPPVDIDIASDPAPGLSGGVDTVFSWKSPGADAAAFEVHWRLTTDPQWSHTSFAGAVQQYTLKDVSIDDYFFGVSSVSADGFESPVEFPGATGSFIPAPAAATSTGH